jgi:aspartate/methionine/tyrosine aminotransferase
VHNVSSTGHSAASAWISDRSHAFEASGIRKVFDLAASLKNPINLSIGQPDFDVPVEIQDAAIDAIRHGKNAYSPTQGIGPLRERLAAEVREKFGHDDRDVFICSGTSGGLVLSMLSMINPGDEVIYLDPYFVMYPALLKMCGGVPVPVDSYPDFRLDVDKIAAAITSRTKMILVNSPANPTGVTATKEELIAVAELAQRHGIALVSDEIYSRFMYDEPFVSPAHFNESTIVIDGFSKSHAMTGWRVGYVHAPREIIQTMLKIQQYSFVCSPQPAQWGALAAMDIDLKTHIDHYAKKRDYVIERLSRHYEVSKPGGAFYVFPKALGSDGGEAFVKKAIERELLVIPGNIFSHRDTHFRISFAASDETLRRGMDVLDELASMF